MRIGVGAFFHEGGEGPGVAGFLPDCLSMRVALLTGGGPDIGGRGGDARDGVGIDGIRVIDGKGSAADFGAILASQREQVRMLRDAFLQQAHFAGGVAQARALVHCQAGG